MRLSLIAFSLLLASAEQEEKRPLKILVYSIKISYSHSSFMGRLADVLSEEGMQVTTLVNEIRADIADGTTKSTVVRVEPHEEAERVFKSASAPPVFDGSSHDLRSILTFVPMMRQVFNLQCAHLLTKTQMLEHLKAEKFDAVIAETFDYCGVGIARAIGARSVIAAFSSSLNDYTAWVTGTPSPWSVVNSAYSGSLDGSITNRLWNLLCVAVDFYVNANWAGAANAAFSEAYGESFPSVQELIANASLVITAADPLLDLARPTQRKIIDIGAVGIREARPLDKEYEGLLNLRPKTVLFSLGSVVHSAALPDHYKRALVQAFSRFPEVTFIWKYEEPERADHLDGVENIVLRKWMPQNDLLSDKRVAALITHGGKTSLLEVGAKGLPAVFIPLFGDQPRNAAIAVRLGFGVFLNKQDLTDPDAIESAIRAVLYDSNFASSAARVASTLRSRPFSSRETLVRHVEFAACFGNVKSLDQEGLDYPLYVYWNVDILLIVMAALIGSMASAALLVVRVCRSSGNDALKKKRN